MFHQDLRNFLCSRGILSEPAPKQLGVKESAEDPTHHPVDIGVQV